MSRRLKPQSVSASTQAAVAEDLPLDMMDEKEEPTPIQAVAEQTQRLIIISSYDLPYVTMKALNPKLKLCVFDKASYTNKALKDLDFDLLYIKLNAASKPWLEQNHDGLSKESIVCLSKDKVFLEEYAVQFDPVNLIHELPSFQDYHTIKDFFAFLLTPIIDIPPTTVQKIGRAFLGCLQAQCS
jgi:hypothetical protein